MTLGITPITGIPLPFVSFGGSSLVSSFIAVGIVLSIASRQVLVMASQDLNPREPSLWIPQTDDRAAGALNYAD
jgi:hypothetical protein